MKQLELDFSNSNSQRLKKLNKLERKMLEERRTLFPTPQEKAVLQVSFEDLTYSTITIKSNELAKVQIRLKEILYFIDNLSEKEVRVKNDELHKLAYILPPFEVNFDARSNTLYKIFIADKLDLKPLRIVKEKRRIVGRSERWPKGVRVMDAPWDSIIAARHHGIYPEIEESAVKQYLKIIAKYGGEVANTELEGSSIKIIPKNPREFERTYLVGNEENKGRIIRGISYGHNHGEYKLPLLLSSQLLEYEGIKIDYSLYRLIKNANKRVQLIDLKSHIPWRLHPFQIKDASRAIRILERTGGVLLAGEMGSGKTLISLSLVKYLNLFPLLIVAPLSAFSTWERHLKEIKCNFYITENSIKKSWEGIERNNYDVVVITYDRLHNMLELIERKKFKTILADEIQRIRTYSSRRSKSLRQLSTTVEYRIGLSGTPLTNSAKDLLPVGSFLIPNEWRGRSKEKDLSDLYPGDAIDNIREHLGSMMVRRRIDETGAKLPKRNIHRVYVDLTLEQRKAIDDLESEVRREKSEGVYKDNKSKIHAFTRLMKMRQITNNPNSTGVSGYNPKIKATIELAKDFISMGRKGVIFCSDRATFRDIGRELKREGIGYVEIWGATSGEDRVKNEKKFHSDKEIKVVLCTIQAGSESWSASPTATWLISTSYMYAPAVLDQMEARVYRMNSDINGPEIEISYIHARDLKPTLDDRMVEILAIKKELFARVVDKREHKDSTNVHYSLSDLLYLITGEKDSEYSRMELDLKNSKKVINKKKSSIKEGLYKKKYNKIDNIDRELNYEN